MASDAVRRQQSDERVGPAEVPATVIDRMAAIDDYLGGFSSREAVESATPTDEPATFRNLLDTLLLLRQSAAASGFVPTQPEVKTPDRIGRYQVRRLAGEGGFSVVWEAIDPVLRRRVALKVRRPDALLSATTRRRFVREAEIASRLVHPHVVTIYEVAANDAHEYIAQEFCEGGSLADWLARHPGPLQPRSAVSIVLALARATSYAHDAGVVHRDIKPANVLLVPAPAGEVATLPGIGAPAGAFTVKLADFGLGKLSDDEPGDPLTQLTRTGASLGTPAWMAPEQIDRSFGEIGAATDVHGLGLLLDRLLTGRALRSGGTTTEIYRQVLMNDPVPPDQAARGVPADLAAVCLKCMAKRPADRYASAAAFAEDLERWLDGRPTLTRPLSRLSRAARLLRRRPMASGLVVATVAAMVAAGWSGMERMREARRGAEQQAELRRQSAVTELRRGFETLRSGNVAGALAQLDKTRSIDPALADSLAGRWLECRAHNEIATLVSPGNVPGIAADAPTDLYSLVVSPDGRMAAIASADGCLRLIRGLDEKPSTIGVAAHDEINAVCFSPDGGLIATVGQEGLLKWWRLEGPGPVAAGEKDFDAGPLYAVAFTADGRGILTGGEDRVVRLTPLDHPQMSRDLFRFESPPGRDPEIESIVLVDDSTLAASCGDMIAVIDVTSGRLIREFDLPQDGSRKSVIGSLDVSPDGRRVVGCGSDSKARVWDVSSGRTIISLPTHPAWVQGCGFSPDGSRLATACRDGGVRLFDAATGTPLGRLVGHVGRVWSVVFEPSGTLLTAGSDGTVRRWDPRRDFATAVLREIPVEGNEFSRLEEGPTIGSSPGRRSFMAIERTGRVIRVDAARGKIDSLMQPDRMTAIEVAADAGRRRIAVSWSPNPRFDLFRIEPVFSAVASTAAPHDAALAAIMLPPAIDPTNAIPCWTPQDELVICSRSGKICMLTPDLARATMVDASLEDPVHAVSAAPAGPRRLAAAGRRTAIIPLPSGSPADESARLLPVGEDSSSVAWSRDGSLLACGTRTGRAILFDAATGTARGQLVPHELAVIAISFSGDGRGLITADSDCVRLTDVATLTTLDEVRPGWTIRSVRLAADDGCVVICGGASGVPTDLAGRIAVVELDRP